MENKKIVRATYTLLLLLFVAGFIVNFSDMINNRATVFGFLLTVLYLFVWVFGIFYATKTDNLSFLRLAVLFWWVLAFIYGVFVTAGVMQVSLAQKGVDWFFLLAYLFVSPLLGIRFVVPNNNTPVFLFLVIAMTLLPTFCLVYTGRKNKRRDG